MTITLLPTFAQASLWPVLHLNTPLTLRLNAPSTQALRATYQALLSDARLPVHQPAPGASAHETIKRCLDDWCKTVSEKLKLTLEVSDQGELEATLHINCPEAVPIYRGVKEMHTVHSRLAGTFMAALRPRPGDLMTWYLPDQAYRELYPKGGRAATAQLRESYSRARGEAITPAQMRRIARSENLLLPNKMRSLCLGLHRARSPLSVQELSEMPMKPSVRNDILNLYSLTEHWRWLQDEGRRLLAEGQRTFWGSTLAIVETERFDEDQMPAGWGLIEETFFERHGGTDGELFTLTITPHNAERLISLTHLLHDMVIIGEHIAYELMMFEGER